MSSQLKISADTSEVKKSILDIGKSMRDLKGSKVSIFNAEDRKFIKSEMKKEITLMKARLKENREEISKMIKEQQKLTAGSKEELEIRKKILEGYKVQAKLAREMGQAQKASKGVGENSGGMMGSLMGIARMIPGIAAVATIGYGLMRGKQANDQYLGGASNRNKLAGLGGGDQNFGSPGDLARVGLTEQDMVQRRIDSSSRLGGAATNESEMRNAGFERAFGLEGGMMSGIANQMRGSMGGSGAQDAQLKLQASVFAAGIEDAVAPYLESAVQLLTSINESGTTQTAEITSLLAQLTKDGERTPEMLAKTFASINDSVKGATGEQSSFLQTAFARAGIGGGTLGGTKFAMSSGGIMGQDRGSLEKRGYNKQLLDSMEKNGMFQGAGQRTGAILQMMQQAGGLSAGESISSISDPDRMVGMNNLANNVFGTKGDQGFDTLMMLEKVQNKQMTQKQFDSKLKEMQEGKDPSISRLDKINGTLAGQTEVLNKINTNLMEALGKEAVQMGNQVTRVDNEGIVGVKNVTGAVNSTGATQLAGDVTAGSMGFSNSGKVGGWLYDALGGKTDKHQFGLATSDQAIIDKSKERFRSGKGFKNYGSEEEVEAKVRKSLMDQRLTAKDIGKEVANALKESPIINNNNTRIQMPDGKIVDKTGN